MRTSTTFALSSMLLITVACGSSGDIGTSKSGEGAGRRDRCGDAITHEDEQCDDGNRNNGDGCSSSCTIEPPTSASCGNGVVEAGEACDDGNANDEDGCTSDCELCPVQTGPWCGDGIVNGDEECDGGNGDWFNCDECRFEHWCGNGVRDDGEQCDDGNQVDEDACNNSCEPNHDNPTGGEDDCPCGNGIVDENEQCDDGNNDNGDGCNADCVSEWPSNF